MPRAFFRLDLLQVLITLALTALAAYLLSASVINKCRDCGGYYTHCTQSEVFDKKYGRFDQKTKTLLRNRLWNALEGGDTNNRPSDTNTTNNEQIIRRNYDWIGICQTAVLVVFWLSSLIGSLATILRNRLLLIICILLNLIHIILLASIEISDDRDFPSNLFRYGRTIALYSILYVKNTKLILVLKATLLVLFLLEYIILLIYFALLRFEQLIHHQLPVEKIPTQPNEQSTVPDRETNTIVTTDFDGTQQKSESPQTRYV